MRWSGFQTALKQIQSLYEVFTFIRLHKTTNRNQKASHTKTRVLCICRYLVTEVIQHLVLVDKHFSWKSALIGWQKCFVTYESWSPELFFLKQNNITLKKKKKKVLMKMLSVGKHKRHLMKKMWHISVMFLKKCFLKGPVHPNSTNR